MQAPANTRLPEEGHNDVRPGDMPQPHLIEDVDKDGNPVLKAGDLDMIELIAEDTDASDPEPGKSSSGPEEKDITD